MNEELRCLTVRQPWAWAIAVGKKNVENRTTHWAYRGDVVIHAAKGWSERGRNDTRMRSAALPHPEHYYALRHVPAYHGRPPHPSGASITLAVVEVVDCHPDIGCCRPWGESSYIEANGQLRTDVHHLVLENPRPLPPIRATGRLGLWRPKPDLADAVEAALA